MNNLIINVICAFWLIESNLRMRIVVYKGWSNLLYYVFNSWIVSKTTVTMRDGELVFWYDAWFWKQMTLLRTNYKKDSTKILCPSEQMLWKVHIQFGNLDGLKASSKRSNKLIKCGPCVHFNPLWFLTSTETQKEN